MSSEGGTMPDYHQTITYKQATEIYDLTKEFCHQYLHPLRNSRLIDQMISSARSVKQNLAEGATRNSVKDYIQFIGYSRASAEELLEDYRDLAKEWNISVVRPRPPLSSLPSSSSRSQFINHLIDLITRTNYLLDRQRRSLEKHFIEKGGYTENLSKKRRNYRGF